VTTNIKTMNMILNTRHIISYVLLTVYPLYNLVNKANLVHNVFYYVYFFSLHVSGDCVPIIRRNDCIYATLGICHSVWMTGMQGFIPPCISDSHPHRVTNTKCRIDTVISPEDGHTVARNM
jgi:hypothetical protein